MWKWKCFVGSRGKLILLDWKDEVDELVWLEFKTSLVFLDGQPPANWRRPFVDTLKGGKRGGKKGCIGLIEIRFECKNVQYRPLGYYSGEREFTIVYFAKEIGGDFAPPTACETAKRHIKEIENNKELSREFWFEKRTREQNNRK